jgi:hypothetical protein
LRRPSVQRQLDAGARVGLHEGADARVAEDQQDVGVQLDVGLARAGRMVDAREQLQAVRVERLAQPRLDLVGIAAGGQLDHVRTVRKPGARPGALAPDAGEMRAMTGQALSTPACLAGDRWCVVQSRA